MIADVTVWLVIALVGGLALWVAGSAVLMSRRWRNQRVVLGVAVAAWVGGLFAVAASVDVLR